jgi:hypothetical protein
VPDRPDHRDRRQLRDDTAAIARRAGAVVIEGSGGSKASAQDMALSHITSDAVVALATLSPRAVELMVSTLRAGCAGTCPSALPKDTSTTGPCTAPSPTAGSAACRT